MPSPFHQLAVIFSLVIQVGLALVLAGGIFALALTARGAIFSEEPRAPLAPKEKQGDGASYEDAAPCGIGTVIDQARHGDLGVLPQAMLWTLVGLSGFLLVGLPMSICLYL